MQPYSRKCFKAFTQPRIGESWLVAATAASRVSKSETVHVLSAQHGATTPIREAAATTLSARAPTRTTTASRVAETLSVPGDSPTRAVS